ncbi:hypothetical protein [Candidatus Poriferisodalis sp.]|uniref:hypothetical protein n=1 Tax=Candidatus Poriferisodalis sp. TaxID=3101277 RepID=UPI003B5C2592
MPRSSWWDEHRDQLGAWVSPLEEFAAESDDETAYLRRAGRYVLWCLDNSLDPALRDDERVAEYLSIARTIEGGRPFAPRTADEVRTCISNWHSWLHL